MKEFPCIEHTLEFKLGNAEFRIWIDTDDVDDLLEFDYMQEAMKHAELKTSTNMTLFRFIARLPKVNAVQMRANVLSSPEFGEIKRGIVAYTVDFEKDPHG